MLKTSSVVITDTGDTAPGAEDVVENANVDTHIGLRERCAMFFGKKKEEKEFREIQLNDPDVGDQFINNKVKTSRYTLLTFLPKNLFEQLRKVDLTYLLGDVG